MEDFSKHYKTLELDKILKLLSDEASFEDSKELCLNLQPNSNINNVTSELKKASDAFMLLKKFGLPSFYNLKSCTESLIRAKAQGSLTISELLAVASILQSSRSVVGWKSSFKGTATVLDRYIDSMFPLKSLEEKIFSSFLSDDEVSDLASSELSETRRKIKNSENKVRERLESFVKSSARQKHLQDTIITIRDSRYVVPVKVEYKNEVPGLVHDVSSSGATLFIEPSFVVEANNEIRILRAKEHEEIERILLALSIEVGEHSDEIIYSYKQLVLLDFYFSKARLASNMNAIEPSISGEEIILINKGRHPLIDKQKVVPVDISIGDNYKTLMITGPNTGGKTVVLKIIGLFTLMTMCGLLIPAAENSIISVYDNIFADIGDEQSIEQSFSTFSGHMNNIIKIIENADSKSLILLDELGAGTDPVEGAALAMAVLLELRDKGATIAATTHYSELKIYALQTSGVENACCEFDLNTLKPTYRLLTGVPGSSNAFAISSRLGLADSVIERAKSIISQENKNFDKVVIELEKTRKELEIELSKTKDINSKMESDSQKALKIREKLQLELDKEIEFARDKARKSLERTKFESQQIIEELEQVRRQKDSEDFSNLTKNAKEQLRRKLKDIEDKVDPVIERKRENYKLPRKLKVGDTVTIIDIDKQAIVIRLPDEKGNVEVQAGIIKTRVKLGNLKLLENAKKVTITGSSRLNVTSQPDKTVQTEINLIGKNTEEAIMELDSFIDHAVMTNINIIWIIHGKGTGILRAAVQKHLRAHKSIRTFRLGTYGEGETGVTIAELK